MSKAGVHSLCPGKALLITRSATTVTTATTRTLALLWCLPGWAFQLIILETGLVYAIAPATYCHKILLLLSLTLSPPQMAWLKGKMGRLDSIRSNRSISSSSTYIYGMGARKQIHKSQLSLYDKISRKISLGRPASRKSSYGHAHVRR